jgi:Ribbon-helix-helix protein, copG family
MKPKLTKKRMEKVVIFHASARDVELLCAAAAEQGVSRSDLLRVALREKARRVLNGIANKARESSELPAA